MAININNLVVRLHIDESNTPAPKEDGGGGCGCNSIDHEAVVKDTIKQVIRILKEQEER